MLIPGLPTRIEESDALASLWIKGGDTVGFVAVAKRASSPKVGLFGASAEHFGDDVVNFHRRAKDRLLHEAVTTPMPGVFDDPFAEGSRNV